MYLELTSIGRRCGFNLNKLKLSLTINVILVVLLVLSGMSLYKLNHSKLDLADGSVNSVIRINQAHRNLDSYLNSNDSKQLNKAAGTLATAGGEMTVLGGSEKNTDVIRLGYIVSQLGNDLIAPADPNTPKYVQKYLNIIVHFLPDLGRPTTNQLLSGPKPFNQKVAEILGKLPEPFSDPYNLY